MLCFVFSFLSLSGTAEALRSLKLRLIAGLKEESIVNVMLLGGKESTLGD